MSTATEAYRDRYRGDDGAFRAFIGGVLDRGRDPEIDAVSLDQYIGRRQSVAWWLGHGGVRA